MSTQVELRLSGLQLQVTAKRFVLRCRLRDSNGDELLSTAQNQLPSDLVAQPLLMRCLSSPSASFRHGHGRVEALISELK